MSSKNPRTETPTVTIAPAALDPAAAAQFVALSSSTMERLVREEKFPKPRLLSGRRVAYLVRELVEWIESRPVSDLPPPKNCGVGRAGKLEPTVA